MKTISLIIVLLISVSLNSAEAQSYTYDIFTVTPDAKWKKADSKGNINFTLQQGNTWAVVVLYKSTGSTGNITSDFQADWNDLVVKNYSVTSEISKDQNIAGGLQMITGGATGSIEGQNVNIILITFTGTTSRSTILITSNDPGNKLGNDIATFMGTLSVSNGSEAPSSSINQNQPPGSNNYQPPMTVPGASMPLAAGFPTPNEQPVTRTANSEGWLVEATNEYIQYSNSEIKVVQYFYMAPEDPNSNTDDEDLFWKKYLSQFFAADQYNKFPNEPYSFYDRVQSASGFATFIANGQQYYLVWIVNFGLKCSFLAITSGEAIYQRYFSHPNDICKLEKYNYFTATKDDLQGSWVNSGFSGAMLYNTNSGMAAGITYASVSEEYTFSGNSTHYFSSGATGSMGAMNTFTQDESGTFQLSGIDLVVQVNKPVPKTHEYWCGFVAGKGGLLLKLANKKFSAQIDFFSRKK